MVAPRVVSGSGGRAESPSSWRWKVSALYVQGCVSNQGKFYDRFDAVVLLSAPAEVILERIENRTTNDYGKTPEERDLILSHVESVEPLLRATCTHEIDATRPLADVVDALIAIGQGDS